MTQEHLDAELVAAWADGSLDPQARAAAEAHAADCMRCQAMLAAMVRTEPAAAEPARGWLDARVRWLVPLATAAAAVMLWVGLSRDLLAPGSPPQVLTQMEKQTEPNVGRAPAPAPLPQAQPTEASKRVEPDPATRQRAVASPPAPPARTQAPPVPEKPAAADESVVALDAVRRERTSARPALTPPPAATVTPPAAATPPQAPPGTGVAPSAAGERTDVRTRARFGQQSATALREVASPDPTVRWRVGAGGAIHRSTDAGKTWVPHESGVTLELFSASAPSRDVCWIVGRSGVVLLTTDGATWRRLTFPEPADLRAVVATDARTAAVTTRDGRVFRTFDGGFTWQP